MLSKDIENQITETQREHYKELKAWLNVNPDIYENFINNYNYQNLDKYIEKNIIEKPDIISTLAKELQYPETHRMICESKAKKDKHKKIKP